MELRTCKVCNQDKPFDPTAKRQTKAQGFSGKVCWACYIEAQAERYRDAVGLSDPRVQTARVEMAAVKRAIAMERMATRLKLQFNLPEHVESEAAWKETMDRRISALTINVRTLAESQANTSGQNSESL